MSGTAVATLPTGSDPGQWSPEEKALVEAAGLVHTDARSGDKTPAPRPVVAAFLQHCQRTGLDPFARQIYSIARKSKGQLQWTTQISIDGARLVVSVVWYDKPPGWCGFIRGVRVPGCWGDVTEAKEATEKAWEQR